MHGSSTKINGGVTVQNGAERCGINQRPALLLRGNGELASTGAGEVGGDAM